MERIMLWGTGNVANTLFDTCMTLDQYELLGVIDNDKKKQKLTFRGLNILSPDSLYELKNKIDKIVILTDSFNEIKEQIISIDSNFTDIIENKNYFYKQSILKRYEGNNDEQIKAVISRLHNHPLEVFNYEFVHNYKDIDEEVQIDSSCGLFYVLTSKGNKLYFNKNFKDKKGVLDYYKSILMEQDDLSPHRYLEGDFNVKDGDVVVDVGVAEGNFSLKIIDRAKKVYLIESDPSWIEALYHTFSNYSDKVEIINGYVSSYNEGRIGTLDRLIEEKIDFLKMDIEGAEYDALIGASNLLSKSDNMKAAICCYHSDFDQVLIEGELAKHGFRCSTTAGYMWFPYTCRQSSVSTKLNRGIVRGIKKKEQM